MQDCADFYRRAAEVFDAAGEFMRGVHAARHQRMALIKAGDAVLERAEAAYREVQLQEVLYAATRLAGLEDGE